jgi:hypothetical protein
MGLTLYSERSLPATRIRQFVGLWALAALTYGAGDILSTFAIVYASPYVSEANVIVSSMMGTFGQAGLIAVKGAIFAGCLSISIQPFRSAPEEFLFVAPPAILSFVGVFITTYNLVLLVSVS